MAQALLTREGKITSVVTMSVERCRALEDPARAAILHILSHRQMSAAGLARELGKHGYAKAVTTIRHHIDLLRDCGLVEVVRLREVRGAVEKYYAPTVKFLGFEDAFLVEGYGALINETSQKLLKIILSIAQRHGRKIMEASGPPCRYCDTHHSREYILFEVINRAMAAATQSAEFAKLQKLLKSEPKSDSRKVRKTPRKPVAGAQGSR
jgi:DNA-binding transcriptional ArsR family regulator